MSVPTIREMILRTGITPTIFFHSMPDKCNLFLLNLIYCLIILPTITTLSFSYEFHVRPQSGFNGLTEHYLMECLLNSLSEVEPVFAEAPSFLTTCQ